MVQFCCLRKQQLTERRTNMSSSATPSAPAKKKESSAQPPAPQPFPLLFIQAESWSLKEMGYFVSIVVSSVSAPVTKHRVILDIQQADEVPLHQGQY